ncbi:hypothetical protein BTO30_07230 [Domibacillus antri]|uniref:L,D-TPase catalytic domain-containing protein n=1 Tax=Domibacillus antri TaxID=1714264 RepID=A0A1Q8Q6F6_9BACI|nr:L,D-transpeptidase family protein [Domibacillus antri]OLN22927.1 hypothetical protein BTO30_07230 [Domibacillus antri]
MLKQSFPAVTGKSGLSFTKKEGDGATPAGIYPIGNMFGTAAKPPGVKSKYTVSHKNHYWIDDVTSPDYNKWVYYNRNPNKKWKSFERLKHVIYKHAIIIRYNENPIIQNKGSAIFIHLWRNSSTPTAGCLALSEANLKTVMKWIDPAKTPKIIIGTPDSIKKEINEYNK